MQDVVRKPAHSENAYHDFYMSDTTEDVTVCSSRTSHLAKSEKRWYCKLCGRHIPQFDCALLEETTSTDCSCTNTYCLDCVEDEMDVRDGKMTRTEAEDRLKKRTAGPDKAQLIAHLPEDDMDEIEIRKPIATQNADIPPLSHALLAMQHISAIERKRLLLQDRLWNMSQKLTGIPGRRGTQQGLDAQFAMIDDLERKYRDELDEAVSELGRAEAILDSIPDENMRRFVNLKYVMDTSRKEIMKSLNMKRWLYDRLIATIEHAPDMKHVKWPEKYILQESKTQKQSISSADIPK